MNTSDFAELRAAAAIKAPRVFVDRALLAELLLVHDARQLPARPIAVTAKYPDEFEECWAAYPKRPGASKSASYKAWAARLKAGASAVEMLAGTRKYAAYVAATRTDPHRPAARGQRPHGAVRVAVAPARPGGVRLLCAPSNAPTCRHPAVLMPRSGWGIARAPSPRCL